MAISLFFSKEPKIDWRKMFCPICGEPTGDKSKCYENAPNNLPPHKRKLITGDGGIMPIYSKSCSFRQDNFWEASINYPVSKPLLSRLAVIEGIDKIIPVKPYSFNISVGKSFDELEVRKKVNVAYRTFIKEMQSRELGLMEYPPDMKKYAGITLPNGNVVKLAGASKEMQSILDNIPGATGIVEKGNDNG